MAPHRIICQRCRRPEAVCYCQHIQHLPTRTRVLLLQHPRERRVAIGTARMAHLSLPNSDLRVGLDFTHDTVVSASLRSSQPACLLFPHPGAMDVSELARDRPVTLIVLDGTWALARKLLTLNPTLAALPRVAFTPRHPSRYRIRRQPQEFCLSTIEALAEVLDVLEPDNGPFDRLLAPFHAMVDRQVDFIAGVGAHRHRRRPRVPRPSPLAMLAERLTTAWPRLLCVEGDTNAWPRRDSARPPPEIVHWVAHRPATGENYRSVIAPRRTLGPVTPERIEISAPRLAAGEGVGNWQRSWRGFVRSDDVLVTWGTYHRALAEQDGLALPPQTLDLRAAVLHALRTPRLPAPAIRALRAGLRTADTGAELVGVMPSAPMSEGRAGRRLAALVGIVGHLSRGGGLTPEPPLQAEMIITP